MALVGPAGDIRRNMVQQVTVDIQNQMRVALESAGAVEDGIMRSIVSLLGSRGFMAQNAGAFQEIHRAVGEQAQIAMVNAYTHRRYRRPTHHYRSPNDPSPNERYSGAVLRRALQREDMILATSTGLSFINVDVLDAEAKQWRRINFGAGGKAGQGGTPATVPIVWDGLVVASLGLPPDPRPPFRIPRGYWIAGSGERIGAGKGFGDEFYPVGAIRGRRGRPSPARMTAGIAASNFMDRGVAAIAGGIPPAYAALYRERFDTRLASISTQAAAVGVTPAPGGHVTTSVTYRRDRLVGGGFSRTTWEY